MSERRATEDSSAAGTDAPTLGCRETVSLGEVDPAPSRHAGRRSAVLAVEGTVAVGTAQGTVRAFVDSEADVVGSEPTPDDALSERWHSDPGDGNVVALAATPELILAGERGPAGRVRALSREDGQLRWRHDTAEEVGKPTTETRFLLPFVVDVAAVDGSPRADGTTSEARIYVAARRYERDGDGRQFESVVYAFSVDGHQCWRYRTDASPIALSADSDRVAVAYNRCPGDHADGLVVLDAADGTEQMRWDPPGSGDRRVGDVALLPDGLAVASHADYRGYRLDSAGEVRWGVDLATTVERGGQRLYAYPNHVHATSAGAMFVTGNTYPEEGRETDARHPDEHTAFGVAPDGTTRWRDPVGGFASGIAADADHVAVPSAQNFRTRDPDTHGLGAFDLSTGRRGRLQIDGVATAASIDGDTVVVLEEPVRYHDEGRTRGAYRLHVADWGTAGIAEEN